MGLSKSSERELIECARSGDRAAQSELWRIHRRWVASIALVHRPRTVEVDDIMQDVAIKFISKLNTLREPAAFRPWLRRIVINVCRGTARSLKPTLRLADSERDADGVAEGGITPVGRGESFGEVEDRRESADCLYRQAMTLPPDYREPLLLRCVQSLSYQQIADILQLPITTIETRLARARRMLREEYEAASATGG